MNRMFLFVALLVCGATLAPMTYGDEVTLTWTAPGDDDNVGTAASYDLRYAQFRITPDNWDRATPVTGMPQPLPAGSQQSVTLTLDPTQRYYFSIRACDEAGNWSPESNSAVWAHCVCIDMRGNADGDPYDDVTMTDLIELVAHVFRGQANVACPEEGNVDGSADGLINLADINLLIGYLYRDFWTYRPAPCP